MAQSFQPTAFELTAFEALVIFAIISGGGAHAAALPTTARQNSAAISGSGGHVARGVKNGRSASITGVGKHLTVGFKSATGTTTAPQGFESTAFQLNAFQAGSGYSSTQGRIAGGGSHRSSGFKPTNSFGRISDSGYLLSAGQKNALAVARTTGSGGHLASGIKTNVALRDGKVSGSGGHQATGYKNFEFGKIASGGAHRASGTKIAASVSAFLSGGGQMRARGRNPTIFNLTLLKAARALNTTPKARLLNTTPRVKRYGQDG